MPELAEVEFSRLQWNAGLGDEIIALSLHPRTRLFRDAAPARLRRQLPGRVLRDSRSHGKRLLFTFDDKLHLEVHLGMTGRLATATADHRPAKHDHFVLRQSARSLRFNDYRQFGRVLLHETADPWAELPPQPLDAGFSLARVTGGLRRHGRTPIKAFLLDQELFPGVGNWMADEILWRARLHPETPSGDVDPALIRRETRAVCRGALRYVAGDQGEQSNKLSHHTETPDWGSPPATWLFQHRWTDGGACPRRDCRAPLERRKIRQRTACYCPVCQG